MDIVKELNKSLDLIKKGEIFLAKKLLVKILEKAPKNPQGQSLLGIIHIHEMNLKEGKELLSKSLQTDPKQAEGYLNLGLAFYYEASFEEAFLYINQAIKIKRHYPEAYFIKALCFEKCGKPNEAISNYHLAIEQNEKYHDALINLAYLYMEADKYSEACSYFQKAITLNPNNKEILNAISSAKIKIRLYKDAIHYLTRSRAIDHNQREVDLNLGFAFLQLGELEQSIVFFSEILQKNPDDFVALNNRASSFYLQKNYKDALVDVKKAMEIDPNYSLAYFTYGKILTDLREYDEALNQFNKCISIEPNYFQTYGALGFLYYNKREYEKALEFFNLALLNLPNDELILNNRGANYKELKLFDLALIDYEKAIDINPNCFLAEVNRASLYDLLKLFDKAEIAFLSLLKKYPEHPNLQMNCSVHFLNLKKFKEGWQLYESRSSIYDPEEVFTEFYKTCKNKLMPWDKNNSNNKILIVSEQGIGDQILHLSLLSDFIKININSDITVLLDYRLKNLFERSFSNSVNLFFIATKKNVPLKDMDFDLYDSFALSGDLMQIFRSKIEDFKGQKHFLISDRKRTVDLKNKFSQSKNKICGISWISKNADTSEDKSLPNSSVFEILSLENFHFINLNYAPIGDEIYKNILENDISFEVEKSVDNYEDIDGLTSLIDACDIIVTISNVTAHIAGALGKKTLLLMPHAVGKHWYWHENDKFSLWYPSIKIFRQNKDNDWTAPLFQLKDDLRGFLNE